MILENNSWKNITNKDVKPFTDRNFEGVTYVAADKKDNTHFFVSTYRNGVYEFKNDAFFKRYNHLNSTIENFHGNDVLDDYLNVDGVCFDSNNNLWMNNTGTLTRSPSRIKVLLSTGNWIKLDYLADGRSF
jgi:sugar lactone lactonase YvrE